MTKAPKKMTSAKLKRVAKIFENNVQSHVLFGRVLFCEPSASPKQFSLAFKAR